jgi:hypothetical protein
VTLGHGITRAVDGGGDDVRAHEFLGDYEKVLKGLQGLPEEEGVYASSGVQRDTATGLVSAFVARK